VKINFQFHYAQYFNKHSDALTAWQPAVEAKAFCDKRFHVLLLVMEQHEQFWTNHFKRQQKEDDFPSHLKRLNYFKFFELLEMVKWRFADMRRAYDRFAHQFASAHENNRGDTVWYLEEFKRFIKYVKVHLKNFYHCYFLYFTRYHIVYEERAQIQFAFFSMQYNKALMERDEGRSRKLLLHPDDYAYEYDENNFSKVEDNEAYL
jgi:hypothetical protein